MKKTLKTVLCAILLLSLIGVGAFAASMGEQNALRSANMYLSFMGFSRSGLIDQLKFDGYSEQEAVYAADNCGADWKEQALKSGESYLSYMGFSRKGLIEQLEFDGYSASDAAYAADILFGVAPAETAEPEQKKEEPEKSDPIAVSFENYDEQLDTMTTDELEALHRRILQKITLSKLGDTVYDEDGISIVWMGMKGDKQSNGKADRFAIIIVNNTDTDYYFSITRGAVNGINLDLVTNRGTELVESGLSTYTGSTRRWLFDEEALEALQITHANEIYLSIDLFLEKQTNKWPEDAVVRNIQVRFNVDEEIP